MTDEEARPSCERCGEIHDKCKAHNVAGKPCGMSPRIGLKVCRLHGGSTPAAIALSERRKRERAAQAALESFGVPVTVNPHEALLQELHRTAGAVAWLGAIVADLDKNDITWGQIEESSIGTGQWPGTDSRYGADVNVWVKLWQAERTQLVRVSKECISAGIEERRVALAEAAGEQIAGALRAILDALGLTPEQRIIAGQVVPAQLRRLSAAS